MGLYDNPDQMDHGPDRIKLFVKLAHFYSFTILELIICSSVLGSAKAVPRNKSCRVLIRNIKFYLMRGLVTDLELYENIDFKQQPLPYQQ